MQSRWDRQWAVCNCVKVSSMSVHNLWKNEGLYYYYFLTPYDMISICNMKSDLNTVNCLPILIQKKNATIMCVTEANCQTSLLLWVWIFLWASVSLLSILISVNSSTCSYSRVEDVCSWALTETSDWRTQKKRRYRITHLYRFRFKLLPEQNKTTKKKKRSKNFVIFFYEESQSETCNSPFSMAKNTMCICGLWGFKKHCKEKLLKTCTL